jgi:hypothetical protein
MPTPMPGPRSISARAVPPLRPGRSLRWRCPGPRSVRPEQARRPSGQEGLPVLSALQGQRLTCGTFSGREVHAIDRSDVGLPAQPVGGVGTEPELHASVRRDLAEEASGRCSRVNWSRFVEVSPRSGGQLEHGAEVARGQVIVDGHHRHRGVACPEGAYGRMRRRHQCRARACSTVGHGHRPICVAEHQGVDGFSDGCLAGNNDALLVFRVRAVEPLALHAHGGGFGRLCHSDDPRARGPTQCLAGTSTSSQTWFKVARMASAGCAPEIP